MAVPDGNVIEFQQKRFEDDYSTVTLSSRRHMREAKLRRWAAYLLKAIAIFGGIAIAAGLNAFWSHVVGLAIAVVVAMDALSSNHKRLLIVTAAANAYSNLLRNINQTYMQRLAGVLKLKKTDKAAAETELESLIDTLLNQLNAEQNRIEEGLQADDLKLLKDISLEQHTAVSALGAGPK